MSPKAKSNRLPLLDTMLQMDMKQVDPFCFQKTVVICVHHALQTSVDLLDAIFCLGVDPGKTFVLNKFYSENKASVDAINKYGVNYQVATIPNKLAGFSDAFNNDIKKMWIAVSEYVKQNSEVENILIMDHGGYATKLIPEHLHKFFNTIAIEKTTSGFNHFDGSTQFPVIDVACSAAKKKLEPALIAYEVLDKLAEFFSSLDNNTTCGVVGYGSIGKAIADKLVALGFNVFIFDPRLAVITDIELPGSVRVLSDQSEFIGKADVIFGCTGNDTIKSIGPLLESSSSKILISCSSGDKEYLTFLRFLQDKVGDINPDAILSDVKYINDNGGQITVVKGGYPANFDNRGETIPADDIQLTRALALAGVIQAFEMFFDYSRYKNKGRVALSAALQHDIALQWLNTKHLDISSNTLIDSFNDLNWIMVHSSGASVQRPEEYAMI